MNFDPITYAAVQQLLRKESSSREAMPKYEYTQTSRVITVLKNAELTIRAMGAGGGGSAGLDAKGGTGGTVALKTLTVAAGDVLDVTIPAGGISGAAGGTLIVKLNSKTILTIPGGGGGGTLAGNPTGADRFIKSTPPGGYGGGSAMLLEGYSASGMATLAGGAGVLGNGAYGGGGALTSAIGNDGGSGMLTTDTCILRFVYPLAAQDASNGFGGGPFGGGGYGGTGRTNESGNGGNGGFGGGGGGGGLESGNGGNGGFGGGGGGAAKGNGGNGGFGGGGGGGGRGTGGSGGQGWVTFDWRYI